MNFMLYHTKLYPSYFLGVFALLFFSCGSYQRASYYDDDGIYSSRNRVVVVEKRNADAYRIQEAEGNLYSDYFGQRASEYDEILDSEVFTDIDGYSSATADDSELGVQENYLAKNNNYTNNAGWGDNPSNISINVYGNGWRWNNWGWNNWGWGGFGWGWNNPWGWNNWGWGGFGWGWNNPWRWNNWGWGGFGWGWNNWGWVNYGGWGWNGRSYNRNIAFNRSRRSYLNSSLARNNLRGRSNLSRLAKNRSYVSNGRSILDQRTSVASRSYRNNTMTRRSVGTDAFTRNQGYRSSRSSRSTPKYSGITRSNSRYSGSTRSSSSARTGTATRYSGTYNRSGQSTRSYQSSTRTLPRSSSYGRSSSRSSGYRSSAGSSGSFRSSSPRSSGSFGRSSGGRSGGRRN